MRTYHVRRMGVEGVGQRPCGTGRACDAVWRSVRVHTGSRLRVCCVRVRVRGTVDRTWHVVADLAGAWAVYKKAAP